MRARNLPGWSRFALGLAALLIAVIGTGCASRKPPEPMFIARFHLETSPNLPAPWAVPMVLPRSEISLAVVRNPVLTEADLANVELVQVDLGLCLLFQFTENGARQLFQVTGGAMGRRLILAVNGQPIGVRVIDAPVMNGQWLTFTELDDDAVTQLAVDLKRSILELRQASSKQRK